MFQKIINIFKNPFKIPGKIYNKIMSYLSRLNYNEKIFIEKQNQNFSKYNLHRELGLQKLKQIKDKYQITDREMSSEHEVFFSSLSQNNEKKFKNILEIGTFDGHNAYLLSQLFQDAQIDTIDLDEEKDDFKNYYGRHNEFKEFSEKRNSVLNRNKRINFIKMNSLKLCISNKKYDLIWIDGAHGYPGVCIDIINSLRLINSNGIILCDDVYINRIVSDKMYNSIAAYEVLTELKKEEIIDFNLIYKRLDLKNNSNEKNRKFIAIFNLIKSNQ